MKVFKFHRWANNFKLNHVHIHVHIHTLIDLLLILCNISVNDKITLFTVCISALSALLVFVLNNKYNAAWVMYLCRPKSTKQVCMLAHLITSSVNRFLVNAWDTFCGEHNLKILLYLWCKISSKYNLVVVKKLLLVLNRQLVKCSG